MDPLTEVIIIGFAAWRVAALISYEKGPFDVFLKLRIMLGFIHGNDDLPNAWPDRFLPNLVSCVWCLGGYSAVAMWGMWQIVPQVVVIFAAWSIIIAVERWNNA